VLHGRRASSRKTRIETLDPIIRDIENDLKVEERVPGKQGLKRFLRIFQYLIGLPSRRASSRKTRIETLESGEILGLSPESKSEFQENKD